MNKMKHVVPVTAIPIVLLIMSNAPKMVYAWDNGGGYYGPQYNGGYGPGVGGGNILSSITSWLGISGNNADNYGDSWGPGGIGGSYGGCCHFWHPWHFCNFGCGGFLGPCGGPIGCGSPYSGYSGGGCGSFNNNCFSNDFCCCPCGLQNGPVWGAYPSYNQQQNSEQSVGVYNSPGAQVYASQETNQGLGQGGFGGP
jgi:hypothetical protein